jgi:hypothetical protein
MNKFLNKLPLLAFVLAAFAAVAFTGSKDLPGNSTMIWAEDPSNPGHYINVTTAVSENRFSCEQSQLECRVVFSNDDPINGVKTVLQTGEFTEL